MSKKFEFELPEASTRKISRLLIVEQLLFAVAGVMLMKQVLNPNISKFTLAGELSLYIPLAGILYTAFLNYKHFEGVTRKRINLAIASSVLLTYLVFPFGLGIIKGKDITSDCKEKGQDVTACISGEKQILSEGFANNNSIFSLPIVSVFQFGVGTSIKFTK